MCSVDPPGTTGDFALDLLLAAGAFFVDSVACPLSSFTNTNVTLDQWEKVQNNSVNLFVFTP